MGSSRGISVSEAYGKVVAEEGGPCSAAQEAAQQEWIWQYVLKSCNDFSLATQLLDSVHIPDTPGIKKLCLLKLLSLASSDGWYKDGDLAALRGLMDLFRAEGGGRESRGRRDRMELMFPKLILLVRLELALQHLRDGKEDWDGFVDALDRHWGEVVPDTEQPELLDGNDDIRAELWSVNANHRLLSKYVLPAHKREDLDELMKQFLDLAWEEIGPVFLEKVFEDISVGRYVPRGRSDDDEPAPEKKKKTKRLRKTLVEVSDDEPESVPLRPPWTGELEKPISRRLRKRCQESDILRTPDVERAANELKSSRLQLKKQVCDPLPESIEVARNLRGETSAAANGASAHRDRPDEEQQGDRAQASEPPPPPPPPSGKEKEQREERVAENGKHASEQQAQSSKGKQSLMERNHTARTREWDDEEDEIEDTSPSASKRLNLPSTSTKAPLSPLQEPVSSSLRRRRFKRWTEREEQALRKGVDSYGKGRWKAILQANLGVFESRTEVDLKDKWRNIEKAEGIKREH